MSKPGSEASEDFEFIETPAAPAPTPPIENYGVRTTTVSSCLFTVLSQPASIIELSPEHMLNVMK